VIIKLLGFSDQLQWEQLKLFEREAQILQHLDHPRIPQYRAYFAIEGPIHWFALVQQYIPGESLKDRLAQGQRFDERQVQQIATDLLRILIYLHELSPPVIHRDIKPSNIIWGTDDHIYLIDFGAVQERAAVEGATFTVVGTYGYTPIEQFGGRAVPASDLYALGATLIHLVTGVSPADLPQQDLRVQFADRVSLEPYFMQWLEKLTDPAVNQRFSTAHDALEALRSRSLITTRNRKLGQAAMRPRTHQPQNSQIQIHPSDQELLITLPGRRKRLLFLLFLAVLTIPLLLQLGVVLVVCFVLEIPIFAKLPLPGLDTEIRLTDSGFSLSKKLLGFTLPLSTRTMTEVADVFPDRINQKWGVIVQIGAMELPLGRGRLTRAECVWLTQEIKSWLGLP
jgi:serine/threonine protein kinase